MASITRSAHSPNVAPSDGFLASFGLIPSASLARACAGKFAGAGKRHVARRTKTDFGGLAVPAIQEHPPPAAIRRNREIEAAAVSMAAVLGDRRHRPRVQPVDFPRHRLSLPLP